MAHDLQPLDFHIEGMDCAEEVAILKKALLPLWQPPPASLDQVLQFDLINAKLTAFPTPEAGPDPQAIIDAVAATGMRATPWTPPQQRPQSGQRRFDDRRLVLTLLSGAFTGGGWLTEFLGGPAALVLAIYLGAIVAGMILVWPKAWYALRHGQADMNLLMTVAIAGALWIGEWLEGAMVAFLFSVSLLLESWSVSRARRAVAALLELAPLVARIRHETGWQEVRPEEVEVGQELLVRPGEKVPLDGEVLEGFGGVNQAPITGESLPVEVAPGDTVFAGSINGDGTLQIRCTQPADQTTLAGIIRAIGQAQSRRAPAEQWVERFARRYTPAVMSLSLLLMVLPPLLWDGEWSAWFYRALVLLVIACPCALVISTPVSIVAGLATAARQGVLIKGGVFLEAPASLRAIAWDKTGTLTLGQPEVAQIVPLDGPDESTLLQIAAGLESHSNHPLAKAIVAAANSRQLPFEDATGVQVVPGLGATGQYQGDSYWIGSARMLAQQHPATTETQEAVESLQQQGYTVVAVGNSTAVVGLIGLADQLRPATIDVLDQLRRQGIQHLALLTGDHQRSAQRLMETTGLDEVRAELLPEDKVRAIEELTEKYGTVAMVGDGVNDAPALGRATLGIAMGAAGSDAAIETADIALMSDDLSRIPWLIGHSRRTLRIIHQNIGFALGIKLLFVVLTFAGVASLWAAIAADTGAALLVIFNGLRLLQDRDERQLPAGQR